MVVAFEVYILLIDHIVELVAFSLVLHLLALVCEKESFATCSLCKK